MQEEKKANLEQLFPKIGDKRKYERLVNAQIRPTIITNDITAVERDEIKNEELGLVNSDYFKAYINKYYTPDSFLRHYRQEVGLFMLDTTVQWNDELLDKVADYIYKNPTCLPYFLQFNTFVIMGDFLDNASFFSGIYNRFSLNEKFVWHSSYISKSDYAYSNLVGKYRLSIFLAVISRLLDKGINLSFYRFTYLTRGTKLGDIFEGMNWYERIIEYIPEDGYKKEGIFTLSKDTLASMIKFDDLDGFLNFVEQFVSIDHYNIYNDRTMLNPQSIMPLAIEKRHLDDVHLSVTDDVYADAYPSENKIDILDCCQKYRQKLHEVANETKCEILNRRLEELRASIIAKSQEGDFDYSALNDKFQTVYNEIKSLPKHIRTTLLKNIEKLAQEGEINIKIDDPTSLEERVANLEAITTNHQERMNSLEQRIDNLEEAFMSVYDYIDKGTPLPKNITDYITKRHMINIIAHPTKSKIATLRKAILLGSVLLGSLPLLTSSNIEIDTPYRDFTEEPSFIEPASPSIDNITEDGNDILPEENIETIRLYEEIKKAPTVYYKSIYDETQLGVTSQGGIIIRYYLLHEGSCVKILDTEKELHEFINKQGENIRTFTWKAAICSLDKDKISSYIESLVPVPAEYTTYFIDYIPSLVIDFNHKTSAF